MNEGRSPARSDLLGGAGWVFFGLLVVAESWRMERFTAMGATVYTMPGFVPGMIGVLLVLLGCGLAWRGWRRRAASPGTPSGALTNRRVLLSLGLMLLYAGGLIGRIPFWLATALFVTAFTALFAMPDQPAARRLAAAAASGLISTAIVVYVFQEIFLVRLP